MSWRRGTRRSQGATSSCARSVLGFPGGGRREVNREGTHSLPSFFCRTGRIGRMGRTDRIGRMGRTCRIGRMGRTDRIGRMGRTDRIGRIGRMSRTGCCSCLLHPCCGRVFTITGALL